MRKLFSAIFFVVLILFSSSGVSAEINAPIVTMPSTVGPNSTREIVVVFKEKPSSLSLLSLTKANSKLKMLYSLYAENSMVYDVTDGDVTSALANVLQNNNVSRAFPNFVMRPMVIPNDTYLNDTPTAGNPRLQWYIYNLKFADSGKSAWDVTTGSQSVVVGIIDTGVDSSHPDLAGKFASLVDCVSSCREVASMQDNAKLPHGTHVAGLVAASTNNNIGIAGPGYNTKMMMLKVADTEGLIAITDVINAIKWAADHGVKVINMSVGQLEEMLDSAAIATLNDAVSYAWKKGAVIVSAAGNCGGDTTGNESCAITDIYGKITGYASNSRNYPAASPNVISVAALTFDNQLASYSERNDTSNPKIGNWISVSAPGGFCTTEAEKYYCILSTMPPDKYGFMNGTSMASPQVAGIAALLFSANPGLTNSQVKSILESTANKSVASGATNFGMVDANEAVKSAKAMSNITVTSGPSPASGIPSITSPPTTGIPSTIPVTPGVTGILNPVKTNLPKTPPDPFPSGPYCPAGSS